MREKAKKYIIDNYDENWIRVQWNSDDVIDALAEFAEQQLKNCNLQNVSQQRELFVALTDKMTELDWQECYNGFADRVFDRLSNK